MAMSGWVETGVAVVVGRQSGQSQDGMVVCWEMPEHIPNTRWRHDTRSHRLPEALLLVGRVCSGRSSGGGLNTGHHKKAPVHCPCSRLAALHGAPCKLLLLLSKQCCCY